MMYTNWKTYCSFENKYLSGLILLFTSLISIDLHAQNNSDIGSRFEIVREGDITTLVKYLGDDSFLDFTHDGQLSKITHIGTKAFAENKKINKIILPEGLVSIENNAFVNCSNLEYISIPKTLRRIGDGAFSTTKIVLDSLPSSVEYIGRFSFWACDSVGIERLPTAVSSIHDHTFVRNLALSSIHIPSNIKSIGEKAFSLCRNLKVLIIDEGCIDIDTAAFVGCPSLEKLSLPNSIQHIRYRAFKDCKQLKELHLPISLIELGDEAFADCSSLQNIYIPASNPPILGIEAFPSHVIIHIPQSTDDQVKKEYIERGWGRYSLISDINV